MGVLIMRIPKKYKRGKVKTLNDLFKWTYDGYGMMCELHPKASKKRRIQNKWRNRFGIGFSALVEESCRDRLVYGDFAPGRFWL